MVKFYSSDVYDQDYQSYLNDSYHTLADTEWKIRTDHLIRPYDELNSSILIGTVLEYWFIFKANVCCHDISKLAVSIFFIFMSCIEIIVDMSYEAFEGHQIMMT